MKNTLSTLLLAASLAAPAFADPADPQISGFSVSQDSRRVVNVSYTLDEPAYVTIDVLTNGVSIGGQNIQNVVGDCNKLVAAGARSIQWHARKSWPDQRFDGPVVTVRLTATAADVPPDVMDIDLETKAVAYYPGVDFLPDGGLRNDKYRTTHLVMKKVHAAGETFLMGSPTTEANRGSNETQHRVQFNHDYYLAIYDTTRKQFELFGCTTAISQATPFDTDDPDQCPVGGITYNNLRGSVASGIDWPSTGTTVGGYLATIRTATGISSFDLPTEAQWEFACRAGTTTAMYNGVESNKENFNEIAWNSYNSGSKIHAVGGKPANPWGFYDMYGNIYEWCRDGYKSDYGVTSDPEVDPAGPASSAIEPTSAGDKKRVKRSSSYLNSEATSRRSAYRTSTGLVPGNADGTYGFRLCIPLE